MSQQKDPDIFGYMADYKHMGNIIHKDLTLQVHDVLSRHKSRYQFGGPILASLYVVTKIDGHKIWGKELKHLLEYRTAREVRINPGVDPPWQIWRKNKSDG